MDNYGTVVVVCYLIQIPLGIYMFAFMPRRGELGFWYERWRKIGLLFALLPCSTLSLVIQAGVIAAYLLKDRALKAQSARTTRSLDQIDRTGGRPANSSGPSRQAAPDNPFLDAPNPREQPKRDDTNPFL